MKKRIVGLLALLALTMALVGCVVLSGQRITMHHDEAADRLSFLIQYDGIFDSEEEVDEKTLEGLREFVSGSQIMLIDWFGHILTDELREEAGESGKPTSEQLFLQGLVENLSVENLGRYRDPDGRVGVAQEVVIEHASAVLRLANALISEELLFDGRDSPMGRRLREAARDDRQWLRLDGHSLVCSFPVDPREWAEIRLSLLKDLVKEWAEREADEDPEPEELDPDWVLRLLSSGPLSIEQTRGEVSVRVGERDRPTTFRIALREGYRPNLEEELVELIAGDVDRALADRLLGGGAESATPTPELPAWAPPEDGVRAVLGELLQSPNPARQDAALRWLGDFAERWNRDEGSPAAPLPNTDSKALIEGWREWYRELSGTSRVP